MEYFLAFFSACLVSFFLTFLAKKIMRFFKIIDWPQIEARKIHHRKVPLGGGVAVFTGFFIVTLALYLTGVLGKELRLVQLSALFIGGLILVVGGILDDKFNLRPRYQIIFPVLAALVIVIFKIGPAAVTNPWGGVINLESLNLANFISLADVLVFVWLMGMMFTTKFLDGLDGLVSGVVGIGAVMVGFLSLQDKWLQPEVALLAFVFAGVMLGFLMWNFYPAKIFLGEGGSLFTGFILGSLAIISGGKIATTLLVIGVPMLDVARVVIMRLKNGRPFYKGDNEHLHFRLLQSGLTQKQTVWLFYIISFLFGITTLFLQSSQKIIALLFLFVLMLVLGLWFSWKENV